MQKQAMRFPTVFVNHGGGPMPLLGTQPDIVRQLLDIRKNFIDSDYPTKPKAIVLVSAHYECDPIEIMSSSDPPMYYDYSGFPPESYKIQYPAPGSPSLAQKIQDRLSSNGIKSVLNPKRGYDHGFFVPLKILYPEADIPIVGVSMHSSLDVKVNVALGQALEPLRDDGVLIIASGYTFHNMRGFFHPTKQSHTDATNFNNWLKGTILLDESRGNSDGSSSSDNKRNHYDEMIERFTEWRDAPGGKYSHPREEHLIPLFIAAAAGGRTAVPKLIYDRESGNGHHAVSSYLFA